MTDPISLQRQRDLLDCLLDLQKQMEKQAVEDSKFWVDIISDLDAIDQFLKRIGQKRFAEHQEVRNKIASRHIKKNGGSKD